MYIRKICRCILIVNSVCLSHSSFCLLFVFVIYSIKSKSLDIYHIYKIDNNSRGSKKRRMQLFSTVRVQQRLSFFVVVSRWQKICLC